MHIGGCIAFIPFSDICGRPVAAADYIALVDRYHSIAVSGVPIFSAATRPEAYRFMTLVDVMYDHTCGVYHPPDVILWSGHLRRLIGVMLPCHAQYLVVVQP